MKGFRQRSYVPRAKIWLGCSSWFDSTGYAADIKNLRRDFPEATWHTLEEWARKQDWSVLNQS